MFSNEMFELGAKSSVIREIFEYAKKRANEIGKENVFDFSLGNPSVGAPECVKDTIVDLLNTVPLDELFGYTSAVGDDDTRKAIADYLNKTHQTDFKKENVFMTCGAAASLAITFHALFEEGDEIIFFAPFFPEYSVFAKKAGFTPVVVKCDESTLKLDLDALSNAITSHTKAVVLNSPNNPTGAVVSEEQIKELSNILLKKQEEFKKSIFLISDEPYRELSFDDVFVPFLTKYYDNTIVCYSFSKALSLAGERIGYILVPDLVDCHAEIFKAVCGAARALGYVCAPSLFQKVIARCIGQTSDISVYEKNRALLFSNLTSFGFSVIRPQGAFYLFLKSPEKDVNAFCEHAKKYELLLVPSDSFGFEGYVRIASCVSTDMIYRALPYFEKLADDYGLKKED